MRCKIGCVFAAVLLIAATGAQAQGPRRGFAPPRTYYVALSGDDASSGTQTAPFRTIQHAVDQTRGGDTVTIAGGTYQETVQLHRSGRYLGGTIAIAAAEGEKVLIDAEGRTNADNGTFSTGTQDYIAISGIAIVHSGGRGFVVNGSWHVKIENCRTTDSNGTGIMIDKSGGVQILSCEVEKACQRGSEESISVKRSQDVEIRDSHIHHTNHEGIDIKEGSKRVRVAGCEIDHVERQGLYAEAWDSPTCDIRFENNRIHDCLVGVEAASECGGLLSDVWFVGNLIYDNHGGPGIIVPDWGNTRFKHPVRDIYFVGNTVWRNGDPERDWSGGMIFHNPDAENIVVENNIFSQNVGGQIRIHQGKKPVSMVVRNNLIDGESEKIGKGNVTGAAKFVDPENGDFRLAKGSPAIRAGRAVPLPEERLAAEGKTKVTERRVDLGAIPFEPREK